VTVADRECIVYVEDNVANLDLVKRVLGSTGRYEVLGALDGQTGLEIVAREKPRLVLVDLDVPGLNGFEVIRQIKASPDPAIANIPIAVVTANVTMTCSKCAADLTPDARFCPVCGQASAPTEPAPPQTNPPEPSIVGREIAGRYRILEKLGEGGMGAVFRAEQISLKRKVAVKLLRPELSSNPSVVRRFNAEAELAAKLSHPNTVTLFDFGQDTDGSLFIAMELIDGQSLREALAKSAPLGQDRVLAICEQVCVLDFGIAKLRDQRPDGDSVPMTQQGDLLGTPQYMAPEQIRGEQVDGRTDVYALGTMLYEMITGRLPFEGPTVMAVLSKHLTLPPVPPIDRRRDLPISPAMDRLVLDCMQKDPAARPATMELLRQRILELRQTPQGAGRHAAMPIKRYQSRPPGVPQPVPSGAATPVPLAPTPAPVPAPTPAPAPHPNTPHHLHPMTPAPTPPQPAYAGQARGSRSWLWALAIVVLVGGGVGGFVAYDRSRSSDDTGDDPDETVVFTDGEIPGDEGFRSPISGDFTTNRDRDGYAPDDIGDGAGTGSAGFRPSADTADNRYQDPNYGYQLDLPAGFTTETDDANPGMVTASGMIRGEVAMIVAVPMAVDPNLLGDEGMKAAAENIASGFGGTVVRVERKRIQGQNLYTGIYDMQESMRMEVVLYPGSGHVLAVAFGAPHSGFAGTSSTRAALFESGVRVR